MSHALPLSSALSPLPSVSAADAEMARIAAVDAHGVHLRALESLADCHACVGLQMEIWGAAFTDIVPASMLQVAGHVGGILVGAYSGDSLIGFVFGLTGVKHDEIVHWSHMLGVRRDAREMGVGRRLKEYQRAMLASRGIAREFWTFDPLQAKNAHLNINRLGVRVIDYVVDMYGSMGSPLHFGVPTDRLIVECSTGARGRVSPVTGPAAAAVAQTPILTPFMQPGDPGAQGESPGIVRIEVPGDVEFVPPETLSQWRLGTRTHFQWAFLRGYRVVGLMRDPASSRAFYVLARDGHRMDA